ncbi:DUF6655 family protein [Planctomicrobium sp. SH668]|uniref:DUF6655 family protein n=1 Tax=Planctomicrobium sp. SH668 TaxID=3448126 RepID=UPI003F5B7DC8
MKYMNHQASVLLPMFGMTLACLTGCATSTTSNTARTSVEQLLVANAVDQSLDKCNFSSFHGQNVFLQDKYVDCIDKNYVVASTRHRLFTAGAKLVDAPDKADVIVELRAGAVGTTSANSYVGTPQLTLPGMVSIPEVKILEKKSQQGVAKLGLVAYDPETNQALGTGGTSLASADDSNWFLFGVGPYQNGTVKKEVAESTTGPAAFQQNEVPRMVTFVSPPKPISTEGTQLATEAPTPENAIAPAAHAKLPDAQWHQ